MKNVKTQIASSEWAMTPAFIENSGKYSEGIIFNIDYDEHSKSEDFINFSNKFREKYQMEPSLFASKGYELARVIIELLKMGDQTELKKNLLIKKEFKGLQDTIIFDQYGDVIREFNTFKVINGKFKKVK
jgi:branched-chain amino acid transport system substrate-binding protein